MLQTKSSSPNDKNRCLKVEKSAVQPTEFYKKVPLKGVNRLKNNIDA